MTSLNLHPTDLQNHARISKPLTPREIVKKQIADFHYHVTEEDLDRMVVTDQLAYKQKQNAQDDADTLQKRNIASSYEVIDNR